MTAFFGVCALAGAVEFIKSPIDFFVLLVIILFVFFFVLLES